MQASMEKAHYQADTAALAVKLGDSYKHHPPHILHALMNYSHHVLVQCRLQKEENEMIVVAALHPYQMHHYETHEQWSSWHSVDLPGNP